MVRLRYSKRKTVVILVAVLVALVALSMAAGALLRPSKSDYKAASKQADVVANQYNVLKASFNAGFLNTDAADAKALAPVQEQVNDVRASADKLGVLKAVKFDSKLAADYKTFHAKLDNTLNATQDLINGKEFMQAKVYPVCGNSKDFKITSNDITTQIAPCRKVLDSIKKGDVKSSDVLRNVVEFRANLASVQQLYEKGNQVGIAYALLATLESKRGATDYAAYVDKQNVPAAFQTLTNDISAKATAK